MTRRPFLTTVHRRQWLVLAAIYSSCCACCGVAVSSALQHLRLASFGGRTSFAGGYYVPRSSSFRHLGRSRQKSAAPRVGLGLPTRSSEGGGWAALAATDDDADKTNVDSRESTLSAAQGGVAEARRRSSSTSPQKGDVVTLLCRLVPEGSFVPEPLIDGVVLQSECGFRDNANTESKEEENEVNSARIPITMLLGMGNYLPGLHELVLTRLRSVGDRVTDVSIDAGYGDRNPNLVAEISFASLSGSSSIDTSQIKVGTQLQLSNGLTCTVTHVTPGESFVMDGNHPLAGASYKADVELVNVEAGPVMAPYRDDDDDDDDSAQSRASRYRVATFALGCFWGGELEYMREPGVVGARVGYTQGSVADPSYEQVCSGTTGHTEAIAVTYDPNVVTYERLVQLAMDRLGDNKYLKNQVGNDRGTQYRHGIYYHSPGQKRVAERIVASFGEDCVTECLPAQIFHDAEDYHQQYLLKAGQSARKGDRSVIRCYG